MAKPLVIYDWPQGRSKQVVYVSQDHHIHELSVAAGRMWQHADLTLLAGAPVAGSRFIVAYAWPEVGTKQVSYLGQDGHVHELYFEDGGAWQHADLTTLTGAPPAIQVTAGYSWSEGRSKQVVYLGDDGHIHELTARVGNPWRHVDLTAITDAPRPGSNYMVGFGWSAGHSKQIAYVGQDEHVHELYVHEGNVWMHADLTRITNAPLAIDISVGYEWQVANAKQISYVSEDRHIHELYIVPGQGWQHADLSAITNAPPAVNVTAGYAWPEGQSKQVVYLGQDGHIHELAVEMGGSWLHDDLTMASGAPVTPVIALDGCSWSAGNSRQVAYVGEDADIREIWQPFEGPWTYTNLSEIVSALPARF